jgi:diacylglycerol kinase family enzyme
VGRVPAARSLLLVVNPRSGSSQPEAIEERLASGGAEIRTVAVGEAEAADAEGADRVVVAGGDGSIAPVAEIAGRAGVPLAVVPAGTANDFARALGIPDDLEEACELALRGERLVSHELGRVGDRPFVNVASAGLPPAAAREAHGLKKALGPLAYAVGAVRAGLTAKALDCTLTCDGREVHRGPAWQVTVACSGAFGGGASVEADPADGRLDGVAIPAGSRPALAWRAYGLRSGRVERQAAVTSVRCREALLEAAKPFSMNVDGEVCRFGPARFSVEPGAFEVVVP